jgi:quinohemoprotein ethanol dehydrogenase
MRMERKHFAKVRFALLPTLLLSLVAGVGAGAAPRHPALSAAPATLEWSQYGGDPRGTRYSPAASITTANAASLRLAWSFHTGVSAGNTSFEATPVVAGGRLYISAPDDEVFALDPSSGRRLWRYKPTLGPDALPNGVNRGVAYGDGRVYIATLDARVIALDAATGRQLWQRQLITAGHMYYVSAAPLYDRGRVVVGIAAGEQEIRGFVAALDARTGRETWRFHTVPAPGETGGDTWLADGSYLHGGGPVWMNPVADPASNSIIFAVGNPSPDFNGSTRPGLNLFANSIVAVRADTGALAWYFQEVHHDLWDTDPASPPLLIDLRQGGGKTLPAVIEASKTGWLYVLDRRSGRPLAPTPERPAPHGPSWQHAWPTQPEPRSEPFAPPCPAPGLYAHEACIFAPPSDTPTLAAPGQLGGSAWSPVAYSPRTGLAYISANDYPMIRSTTPSAHAFSRAPQPLPTVPRRGSLVGYDVATGRVAWRDRLAGTSLAYGGSAVTAGDIVFSGESAGFFDARDARTGRLVWRYHTGAGADAAPAVYSAGGREYVAVAAGGNSVINSTRGDTLAVFALPGR